MTNTEFTLIRDLHGRLQLTLSDGSHHEGVFPLRAFALSAPDEFIALVSTSGHELVSIRRLADVPEPMRSLIAEEMRVREFVPRIEAIIAVSTYATPSTWHVRTDRGETHFILKAEEDIRRLGQARLLITDSYGLQFEIVDQGRLDAGSRKILARFL